MCIFILYKVKPICNPKCTEKDIVCQIAQCKTQENAQMGKKTNV